MPASSSASVSGLPTTLTTLGSVFSASRVMTAQMVPISTSAQRQRRQRRLDGGRRDGRQVALQVDDDLLVGADDLQRLVDARGAVGMVGAGHHRLAAGQLDGAGDGEVVGGDHHPAETGLDRAAPDMDDHRVAVDVGKRLSRQAGGGHAGGNEDDGALGHGRNLGKTAQTGEIRGRQLVSIPAGLYVLPQAAESL